MFKYHPTTPDIKSFAIMIHLDNEIDTAAKSNANSPAGQFCHSNSSEVMTMMMVIKGLKLGVKRILKFSIQIFFTLTSK